MREEIEIEGGMVIKDTYSYGTRTDWNLQNSAWRDEQRMSDRKEKEKERENESRGRGLDGERYNPSTTLDFSGILCTNACSNIYVDSSAGIVVPIVTNFLRGLERVYWSGGEV